MLRFSTPLYFTLLFLLTILTLLTLLTLLTALPSGTGVVQIGITPVPHLYYQRSPTNTLQALYYPTTSPHLAFTLASVHVHETL